MVVLYIGWGQVHALHGLHWCVLGFEVTALTSDCPVRECCNNGAGVLCTAGKELVVCATALRDFVSIVDTVGGWKEQRMAR